jgi:hypothetical protein
MLAAFFVPAGLAGAADAATPAGSLKWVPADAAFYSSMLRAGEQIDIIVKSKAWAKIKSMPSVQMMMQMAQAHLKNPPDPHAAQVLQLLQQPENQKLLALLKDMISHEVFCCGADNVSGFIELMTAVNGAQQVGTLTAAVQRAQGQEMQKIQVHALLRGLADNLELIRVPDVLVGFKVSNPADAEAQLKRLDTFLTQALQQAPPPIKDRLKKGQGASMFTFTLDGGLVPWDKVSLKQYEDKDGEFDNLIEKLKTLKLTISLGLREDYVILSVGESAGFLSKLGGGSLLADRPEFKPLQKYAGERLTSIAYASKELRSQGGMSRNDIDKMANEAKKYLEKSEMPPPIRERLLKDIGDLATDIKSFLHEQGAMFSFAFLNGQGQESFTYDWSAHPNRDGSKPLNLLHHVGGAPLLAVVSRSKYRPQNYQMLVKWIKHLNGYVGDFVVPQLNEDQKGRYEQIVKMFQPLLERLDKATGEMLLPALKDGQSALVLDAQLRSKQWQQMLPAMDKPMPMLEPALVLGVSDAELLKKAVSEYRMIVNEMISKLHDLNPSIPEFQIPEPQTKAVAGGTIYYHPIPEELGVDKQISPNAGLSNHVAVLAISQTHSERLLANTPLKGSGPLADLKRPLAAAVVFDFAGAMTALEPWIEFGVEEAMKHQPALPPAVEEKSGKPVAAAPGGMPSLEDILKQVRTGIEVLKCFRGYTSATYFEDKALVTHGLAVFEDLP